MKLRLVFLCIVAAISVCLLAACGGGSHSSTSIATKASTVSTTQTVPSPLSGITCDPEHNYALPCKGADLYQTTPNPLLGGKLKGVPTVNGTDTYGSSTNVATSSLTHFNISYLSGVSGKDWTAGGLAYWHQQGKPTGLVWEQGASQAENGCGQGTSDAYKALAEANALGAPSYSVIHAAVDTDASGASVKSYFECWEHVLGPERAGDYGSYFVVRDLNEWGIISGRATWETRAWSQGMRYDNAALYQYAIPPMAGTSINGTGVDLDVATQTDWGQWPFAQKPPVNPHHYAWLPDTKRSWWVKGLSTINCTKHFKSKGCHRVQARERLAAKTFDNTGCVLDKKTHHFKRHACKVSAQHLRLLGGRLYNIAHHTKNFKHKVKKPRWNATHYKVKGHTTTLGGAYRQMHRRTVATGPIKSW